ncbi:FIG002927: hypothetical protein [Enterobacter hormaechei]|nr:FIG002927: hypothetical protein [Enterobacter hormaechei]
MQQKIKKGKKSCCYGNMSPFSQQTDFDLCHNIPATVTNTLNNCSVSWSTYWKNIKTPTDLSLMVLGNMVTNLINTSVAPAQRQAIAKSFAQALQSSVSDDQAH